MLFTSPKLAKASLQAGVGQEAQLISTPTPQMEVVIQGGWMGAGRMLSRVPCLAVSVASSVTEGQ